MSTPDTSSARLTRLLTFIEQDADNLALRKDAVREACATGHWIIARRLLEVGLQSHPHEAELLALSGFALLQAQRYGDAEQALSEALAQGFSSPVLAYNLAFALVMQKRHSAALKILAEPAVSHEVPLGLLLRARCLHQLGRRAEAIADCQAHLAIVADHPETSGLLALMLYELYEYDQTQAEAARSHAKAALSQDPKQLEALLALASMQSGAQEYVAARRSFDTLLLEHPRCGRGWFGLALIELADSQIEAAKRDIEVAATHMPEHIGTWHVLAWVEIIRNDVAAAELAFTKALALDRSFGETHGGLAVIAALHGREDDARAGIKRALRLDSQSLSAQYASVLLLQRHGQHGEARQVIEAVLARPTARGDMRYRDLVEAQMSRLRAID
jgi:tetratricopeptide (TPR) repeat protein